MKSKILFALFVGIVIIACNKNTSQVAPETGNRKAPSSLHPSIESFTGYTDNSGAKFIPVDTANAMISSYLYSINYTQNDSDVRSFTINGDSLRAYLANSNVKNVKLFLAHTMAYVNSGYAGQNAGYQSGALTVIIAGYDAAGNYVYYNGMNVLDHVNPCPYTCELAGSASNNLLQ